MVEHVFRLFDVNDKRRIDFTEFCVGLSKCLVSSKEEKIDFIFSMYDLDRDDQLSTTEVVAFLKANADALKPLADEASANIQ
jgi:Ca2+-binding EF-hand superfamily protein